MFLGRQNIPLRGHRDDGPLFVKGDPHTRQEGESDESNDGNFRPLLRFRVRSGDTRLENHLMAASSRAAYISTTVQNEIISICGQEIKEEIFKRVAESGIYSICFDETTDTSGISQLSLVLRYVYRQNVREDFIQFINAFESLVEAKNNENRSYLSDEEEYEAIREEISKGRSKAMLRGGQSKLDEELSLTGKAVDRIVLRKLKKIGLPVNKCVGIGTDECAVMVSEVRGAVKEIQLEAPNAMRTSCFSHKLNNSLSSSNKVPEVRNAVGTIRATAAFFGKHPKRRILLQSKLSASLTSLCEHRWVERHEAVHQFAEDLEIIVEVLEQIATWRDMKTASKASCLSLALKDAKFIVSLFILDEVLSLSLPLSRSLQGKSDDLKQASAAVSSLISVLTSRRKNAEISFKNVWTRAERKASSLGVVITSPRRCSYQTQRSNQPASSEVEYFRISLYIPVLDNMLEDIVDRFPHTVLQVYNLPTLVPDAIVQLTEEELQNNIKVLATAFSHTLATMGNKIISESLFLSEATMWRQKWMDWVKDHPGEKLPSSAIDALQSCSKEVYRLVHDLFHLLATLPVSSASAERSFSSLRKLKTYIRSNMGQDRLTGLALLCIHRDITVKTDRIIERFAKNKKGKRRINL